MPLGNLCRSETLDLKLEEYTNSDKKAMAAKEEIESKSLPI